MASGGQLNGLPSDDGSQLPPGRVQLWWATPDSFTDDQLMSHARGLPEDERAAASCFLFEEDRKRSLLTRVTVRHVLSQQPGGLHWRDWRFSRTAHGKPVIANPGFDWLSFNLSHTRSLVVCGVAACARLGVDIESMGRPFSPGIVDRYFSAGERSELRRASPELRQRRFLDYWTLKEAFAKALGLGLSLPLDDSSFDVRLDEIGIALTGRGATAGEDPAGWRFFLGALAPAHVLAVAYSGLAPLDISFYDAAPFLRGGEREDRVYSKPTAQQREIEEPRR